MQQFHLNTLDAVRRVQAFFDRHAAVIGSLVSPDTRAELDGDATQLATSQLEQSQTAGISRAETANQAVYRKDFYFRFMRPIRRIARAKLATAPELPDLVAPSTGVRNGDFVKNAEALASSAAKHEKVFVSKGMAADFLVQLNAAIAQLGASRDAQSEAAVRGQAATKSITEANKNARDLLAVLDSVITPAVRHNAQLLAEWKASKKIIGKTALPPQPTGLPVSGAITATGAGTGRGAEAPPPAGGATPAPSTTTPVASAGQSAKSAA